MIGKFPKASGADKYQYLYNSLNQLKEVRVFDSANNQKRSVLYSYDPQGRRMQKKVVDLINSAQSFERNYVYDGPNIIAEYDGSGALLATHTHSFNFESIEFVRFMKNSRIDAYNYKDSANKCTFCAKQVC